MLQSAERTWDLALFGLATDSKLGACDLTKLRVPDIAQRTHVAESYRDAAENSATRAV